MKKVLIVAAVMAFASVASADLMLEVTENAPPLAGLRSYTLTFKGVTVTDRFSAFDGALRGPMSQVWWFKSKWYPSVWLDFFFFPGEEPDAALDSHLLLDHITTIIAVGANEDADTATPLGTTPGGYDRFLGTYIANTATSNMAFAVPAAYQQTIHPFAQPFAQLVIPDGEKVHLTGTAVSFDGVGLPLDVWIPEPATLGLLALGAAGALIRRRRR